MYIRQQMLNVFNEVSKLWQESRVWFILESTNTIINAITDIQQFGST